jgi:hypothetical protein
MDGRSYEWGLGRFRGQGIAGDYWFPVLAAAIVLAILYLGWRGARPGFGPLLLLFHVPLSLVSIYDALSNPEDYRFRGDTLGIDVPLALAAPRLFGGFSALSVYWLARHRNSPRAASIPWTNASRILLGTIVALVPLQYFLLRAPNGSTDGVGVILTISQWVLINVALRPARPSQKAPMEAERATAPTGGRTA